MNTVKLDSLPWVEQSSPKGGFHHFRRDLSLALGGTRDVGKWGIKLQQTFFEMHEREYDEGTEERLLPRI